MKKNYRQADEKTLRQQGKRLEQLMAALEVNQSALARKLDCRQPLISAALRGTTPLSQQNKVLLQKLVGMNIFWYDEGKGNMFISDAQMAVLRGEAPESQSNVQTLSSDLPNNDVRILSITVDRDNNEISRTVPAYAQAGYLIGYRDPEYLQTLPEDNFFYGEQDGTYRTFEISGDSMEPHLYETDFVRSKFLDPIHWRSKLRIGEIFIVVHKEGIICKQLKDHNPATGDITLRSANDIYEDRHLNLADVYELWYYKGYYSRRSFR